ncbi:MAG: DinB family protein [Ignavibacteriales bacterium]|nr:DinB family protein [Ignavibacteriales bacterium]
MNEILFDFLSHQAWADAEHWNAFEDYPVALTDDAIKKRLHHIYEAERAFLLLAQKKQLNRNDFGKTHDMPQLKDLMKHNHLEAAEFMKDITPDQLKEVISIPWFKDPPIIITIEQALTQAAMHSHYHRAQNAARLRELGGEPPLTDLIMWYWKGKPEARWKT